MAAATRCLVGRVSGAHGVRGALKVRWHGDSPQSLLTAQELWISRDRMDAAPQHFDIVGASGAGADLRIQLEGLDDRDEALGWKGAWVFLDVAALEALPEGDHYWHELVGCEVVSENGESIGRVLELWETGAHDVLVVERAGGGEPHLIPTADEFIREIDVAAKRIVIAPLPGLLD